MYVGQQRTGPGDTGPFTGGTPVPRSYREAVHIMWTGTTGRQNVSIAPRSKPTSISFNAKLWLVLKHTYTFRRYMTNHTGRNLEHRGKELNRLFYRFGSNFNPLWLSGKSRASAALGIPLSRLSRRGFNCLIRNLRYVLAANTSRRIAHAKRVESKERLDEFYTELKKADSMPDHLHDDFFRIMWKRFPKELERHNRRIRAKERREKKSRNQRKSDSVSKNEKKLEQKVQKLRKEYANTEGVSVLDDGTVIFGTEIVLDDGSVVVSEETTDKLMLVTTQ